MDRKELARRLGVSPHTILRWETSARAPLRERQRGSRRSYTEAEMLQLQAWMSKVAEPVAPVKAAAQYTIIGERCDGAEVAVNHLELRMAATAASDLGYAVREMLATEGVDYVEIHEGYVE
jgi:transcriptional regulator with XRE-family HTH domain